MTTRGPTDCGGTLVNTSYGTHATGYFFDDKDVLVAVRISNDTAQRCSDQQNESLSITYGTPCAASVPPSVLPCPSGSGGSAAVGGTGGASGSGFAGASGSSGGACASIANAPHAPGTVPPWSPRTDVTEATTCTTPQTPGEPVDECGCENRTCPTGETCVRATQPPPLNLGGPARDFNGCFPLCLDDQDCEAPQVCVGNLYGLMVCADVECRQDGDCTADPCGFCLRGYFMSHGSQLHADPSASRCEYPGNCIDASCGGCTASELGWHHCPAP